MEQQSNTSGRMDRRRRVRVRVMTNCQNKILITTGMGEAQQVVNS